jgi:hypothetical protein
MPMSMCGRKLRARGLQSLLQRCLDRVTKTNSFGRLVELVLVELSVVELSVVELSVVELSVVELSVV